MAQQTDAGTAPRVPWGLNSPRAHSVQGPPPVTGSLTPRSGQKQGCFWMGSPLARSWMAIPPLNLSPEAAHVLVGPGGLCWPPRGSPETEESRYGLAREVGVSVWVESHQCRSLRRQS